MLEKAMHHVGEEAMLHISEVAFIEELGEEAHVPEEAIGLASNAKLVMGVPKCFGRMSSWLGHQHGCAEGGQGHCRRLGYIAKMPPWEPRASRWP